MAFTSTVTKAAVKKINDRDFTVSINVILFDDGVPVAEKTYSERYDSETLPSTVESKLAAQIQVDIDNYKAEQAIFNATEFDTVCTNLVSAIDTYANAGG